MGRGRCIMNNQGQKVDMNLVLEEYMNRVSELEKEIMMLRAYVRQLTNPEFKEKANQVVPAKENKK